MGINDCGRSHIIVFIVVIHHHNPCIFTVFQRNKICLYLMAIKIRKGPLIGVGHFLFDYPNGFVLRKAFIGWL